MPAGQVSSGQKLLFRNCLVQIQNDIGPRLSMRQALERLTLRPVQSRRQRSGTWRPKVFVEIARAAPGTMTSRRPARPAGHAGTAAVGWHSRFDVPFAARLVASPFPAIPREASTNVGSFIRASACSGVLVLSRRTVQRFTIGSIEQQHQRRRCGPLPKRYTGFGGRAPVRCLACRFERSNYRR